MSSPWQTAIRSVPVLLLLPFHAGSAYATPPALPGRIVGVVSDAAGTGQMGATVLLFNKFEKLIHKTLTNERGQFGFDNLLPDSYSIRVNLSAFMPAVRQHILVQPGMRSFLSINLASVLSSVEFVYASPIPPKLMTDDWRWVLRSSMSTRPVLRYVSDERETHVFSRTRGMVRLSAGDANSSLQGGQPDLGTAFAVATSLYGVNNVQVSGNLGYVSHAGLPAASFRTRYSRDSVSNGLGETTSPEVQLTVRQMFLPSRTGAMLNGSNAPALGSMTALVLDRAKVGDGIDLLYGAQMESVRFIERVNILSPFVRAEISAGKNTNILAAFSTGAAPDELFLSLPKEGQMSDLRNGLTTLSAFPRVSMRDGHTHVQRMMQSELTVVRTLTPSTRVSISAYDENVANAALNAVGNTTDYATSEMLPDLFSRASIFNIGSYRRQGVMAAVEHRLGEHLAVQAAFGNSGTLQPDGGSVIDGDADDLRHALRHTQRSWFSLRAAGSVAATGTRISGSYLMTDDRAALPAHRFITQRFSPDLGLNIQIRQPLPGFGIGPGRLEAVAELRNLLQQGYLQVNTTSGRRVTLVPSPKSIRGGLAFIF